MATTDKERKREKKMCEKVDRKTQKLYLWQKAGHSKVMMFLDTKEVKNTGETWMNERKNDRDIKTLRTED